MLRAGHGLMLIVIALLTFGVVMVTSAGLTVGPTQPLLLQDVLFGRIALLAALAVGFMFIGSRVPVHRFFYRPQGIASPIPWMMIVIIALLALVHVPGIGREVNGARRWIDLGIIGFQPSEVAKWGLIIALAWYATRRAAVMGDLINGFVPPMVVVLLVCALIAGEDLGTAVLIGMVSLGILVTAGAKWWHAAMLMPIGALGFIAAVLSSPYRLNRLKAFFDPYEDPQGIGYHILQSMGAISGGGLAGRGLGNSIQKFGYLPEDTTDFIFAIICEEMGLVGAAVVICLYGGLLLCGFSIVRRVEHPFQRLLGFGVLLTVGLQALINIAVVTGSAPTKGIALPLLSSGGTGWALTAFGIGLLVSMDRELAKKEAMFATRRQQMMAEADAIIAARALA
ncbi:MAG: putative lipid II flippase FtsW [Phycisphaerales bacterium]|nr:putative lipid II flippase FtsW [Phycisphaerales bacterium]